MIVRLDMLLNELPRISTLFTSYVIVYQHATGLNKSNGEALRKIRLLLKEI